jgi:NAD(P)H-hydrate epimerase
MNPIQRVRTIPQPAVRRPDAHKGDFGHVLVVGGSVGMAGAPALAGTAALRSGAGLVTVACPTDVAKVVASFEPSLMTLPAGADQGALSATSFDSISSHRSTVLAIGPGIGRLQETVGLVRRLIAASEKPVVVDADGLNAVVGATELLRRRSPTVVTPHPGEFASLTGKTTTEVQSNRESLAVDFALTFECIVVLKGAGTIVTDGRRVFVNTTGNPGMATGGAGDVLTGMISGLIAQKLDPYDAAVLGAHLHGFAGDLVAEVGSQESLIASDLVAAIPAAWRRLHGRE